MILTTRRKKVRPLILRLNHRRGFRPFAAMLQASRTESLLLPQIVHCGPPAAALNSRHGKSSGCQSWSHRLHRLPGACRCLEQLPHRSLSPESSEPQRSTVGLKGRYSQACSKRLGMVDNSDLLTIKNPYTPLRASCQFHGSPPAEDAAHLLPRNLHGLTASEIKVVLRTTLLSHSSHFS
jgi:hypothetical protein